MKRLGSGWFTDCLCLQRGPLQALPVPTTCQVGSSSVSTSTMPFVSLDHSLKVSPSSLMANILYLSSSSGHSIAESARVILYAQGYPRNGFRGSRWTARNWSNSRSRYVRRMVLRRRVDSDPTYCQLQGLREHPCSVIFEVGVSTPESPSWVRCLSVSCFILA